MRLIKINYAKKKARILCWYNQFYPLKILLVGHKNLKQKQNLQNKSKIQQFFKIILTN